MKKAIIWLAVVAVLGLGGWQIYKRLRESGQAPQRGPRGGAVAVRVVPVRHGLIRDVGAFTGTLLPRWQFIVAPKIPGRLDKLLVNIGDPVKAGQLIAQLDDEEYGQDVEEAKAELAIAGANVESCRSALEVATREFGRAKALHDKRISSESDLDAAEAEFKSCQAKQKVALAQVKQREAALKRAMIRFGYAEVKVSWEEGDELRVVGERFVDEGALLKANEPIVSILDDRVLNGVIHVIERDYPKVKVGQGATIATDAYPGRTFPGTIVRIAPLLRETSRQARVEIEIANPQRLLKPGMFIRARIEFARREKAALIPADALVNRGGREGVFVADVAAKKAHFVPVTVGIVEGEVAEVAQPELSGPVVTLGIHLLQDKGAIMLPRPAAPGPPARAASGPASRAAGGASR